MEQADTKQPVPGYASAPNTMPSTVNDQCVSEINQSTMEDASVLENGGVSKTKYMEKLSSNGVEMEKFAATNECDKGVSVEKLVESIQGTYSFIQDSEVDSEVPLGTYPSTTTDTNSWTLKAAEDATHRTASQDWAAEVEASHETAALSGSWSGSSKPSAWNNMAAAPQCPESKGQWTDNSSGVTGTFAAGAASAPAVSGSDDIFAKCHTI